MCVGGYGALLVFFRYVRSMEGQVPLVCDALLIVTFLVLSIGSYLVFPWILNRHFSVPQRYLKMPLFETLEMVEGVLDRLDIPYLRLALEEYDERGRNDRIRKDVVDRQYDPPDGCRLFIEDLRGGEEVVIVTETVSEGPEVGLMVLPYSGEHVEILGRPTDS